MKRTRLERYTALVSRTKLRRTPLPPVGTFGEGGSAALSQPPRRLRATRPHRFAGNVRAIVVSRSGGRCEIAIDGCWGTARELHHRITQKAGGRHRAGVKRSDRPSNMIDVCGRCHAIVTDHPSWAYTYGWSLKEGQEPTAEAVLYRGQPKYLTDDGQVIDHEEAGA